MAGDGNHGHRCLDGGIAEKVQAQLGILAFPVKQRAVDRLGCPRSRLCSHRPSNLPRLFEHPWRNEERVVNADLRGCPFWVKITRIRYEDGDLDKATRLLGLHVLPREGPALAARPGAGCLSGKLVHRLRR